MPGYDSRGTGDANHKNPEQEQRRVVQVRAEHLVSDVFPGLPIFVKVYLVGELDRFLGSSFVFGALKAYGLTRTLEEFVYRLGLFFALSAVHRADLLQR
ncbi:MAG: hypothetical protein ACOZE7_07095 [Pseudomonadota bacterium]